MPEPVPPNYWQLAGLLGRGAAPIGQGLMGMGDPEATLQAQSSTAMSPAIQGMIDKYSAMPSWTERASEQLTDPRSAVAQLLDPARIETAMGMVGPGTTKPVGKGITVYHGSPHDFERFDMSRIGTGEGAQAYGHGLYFAENEGVAKAYRNSLSPGIADPVVLVGGKTPPVSSDFISGALRSHLEEAFRRGDADPVQAVTDKLNEGPMVNSSAARENNARMIKEFEEWKKAGIKIGSNDGRMYQVAINADPEHFLHWDKPLSEQSEHVRSALEKIANPQADQLRAAIATVEKQPQNPTQKARLAQLQQNLNEQTSGRAIVQQLGRDPEAAQSLREAGIPGIKYLDQGSRFQPQQVDHLNTQIKGLEDMLAGASKTKRPAIEAALKARRSELSDLQPTHNYVVFDDKMIDILKKYGLAGLGIPALGAAAQDNRQ